jgi:hypothetical protein
MKWKAEFFGRRNGAIGRDHSIVHEFESTTDPDQAHLDIYKTHEHVAWLRLTNEHGDVFVRNYDTDRAVDWTIKRNQSCEQ